MMNQMMNPDFNASREAMLREVDQAGLQWLMPTSTLTPIHVTQPPLITIIRWQTHTETPPQPLRRSLDL